MTENEPAHPAEGGQEPYREQPTPPDPPFGAAPLYGQPVQAPVSPSDARMWSLFAHLGGIFFSFVAPLVIYLIYKDRDPFVRRHSTQALNFQIIAAIAYVVSGMLPFIGILTGFATFVCVVVFSIMGAVAANAGREYTYPFVPQMVT
jgi:uncharacterized protein